MFIIFTQFRQREYINALIHWITDFSPSQIIPNIRIDNS